MIPVLFIRGKNGYVYCSLNKDNEQSRRFIEEMNPQRVKFSFVSSGDLLSAKLPFDVYAGEDAFPSKEGDVFLSSDNTLSICLTDGERKGALLSRTRYSKEKILALTGEAQANLEWPE